MLPTTLRNKTEGIEDTAMIMKASAENIKRVTNVLLVSSDSMRRKGIANKLSWVDKLYFSDSVGQLFERIKLGKVFDSILTELTVSGASGFLVISRIQELFPTSPVIVVHHAFDEEVAAICFHFGAADFLAPTPDISEKSFERAIKLASLRSRFGPKARNLLSRLDILSARARESACGTRRESSSSGEQVKTGPGVAKDNG